MPKHFLLVKTINTSLQRPFPKNNQGKIKKRKKERPNLWNKEGGRIE